MMLQTQQLACCEHALKSACSVVSCNLRSPTFCNMTHCKRQHLQLNWLLFAAILLHGMSLYIMCCTFIVSFCFANIHIVLHLVDLTSGLVTVASKKLEMK